MFLNCEKCETHVFHRPTDVHKEIVMSCNTCKTPHNLDVNDFLERIIELEEDIAITNERCAKLLEIAKSTIKQQQSLIEFLKVYTPQEVLDEVRDMAFTKEMYEGFNSL